MSDPAVVIFFSDETELVTEFRTVGILPSPMIMRIAVGAFSLSSPTDYELMHGPLGVSSVELLLFSYVAVLPLLPLTLTMKVSPVVKD